MSKENIPNFLLQFWSENPTIYTKDDIFHLEPLSQEAVFLKYLALLNSGSGGGGEKIRGFITADNQDFMTSDSLIFSVKS